MVMTCAGCFKTTSHDYGKYFEPSVPGEPLLSGRPRR